MPGDIQQVNREDTMYCIMAVEKKDTSDKFKPGLMGALRWGLNKILDSHLSFDWNKAYRLSLRDEKCTWIRGYRYAETKVNEFKKDDPNKQWAILQKVHTNKKGEDLVLEKIV